MFQIWPGTFGNWISVLEVALFDNPDNRAHDWNPCARKL